MNLLIEWNNNFFQKTMAGELGKVPKFQITCVCYVNTYLKLLFAIKTNDFTLFHFDLFQLSQIYFSIKHL